jgi:DNA-binding GntR family transcriptional regulator
LANTTRQRNKVRRVQGQTLRELAYGELRRAVLTGQFAPGEPITIAELSKQLGIGAMPTREAVQQLASQGAFEFLPNRSVRVPVIAQGELESLFEARLLLEGFVTARAAENITREDLARISANLETLIERTRKRVAADCLAANFEFHFSIYRASRSPYVVEMIEHLWLRMSPLHIRVFRTSKADQDDFLSAMPKHRKLVEALRKGDAAKAQATITAMLEQSLEWDRRHAPA